MKLKMLLVIVLSVTTATLSKEVAAGDIYALGVDGCKRARQAWKADMLCEFKPIHYRNKIIEFGDGACEITKTQSLSDTKMQIVDMECDSEGDFYRTKAVVYVYNINGKKYFGMMGDNMIWGMSGVIKSEFCFRVSECTDKYPGN